MPENKVEIEFKTTADTTGSREVQGEIKKVEGAVKGESAVNKEATEVTQGLSDKKQALLHNVKQLSSSIPGLHSVVALLRHPVVALGVALGIAVDAIRNYFQKLNEAIAQQHLAESIREQASAISAIREELAGASADFAAKLAEAAAKGKDAAAEFKKYADQLERIRDLQERLADAELSREKSQIKLALAKKQVTPIQAEEMSLAAEGRADKRKEEAQARAAQSRADNLRWAIRKTEGELERARGEKPSEDEIARARAEANIIASNAAEEAKDYEARRGKLADKLSELQAAETARVRTGSKPATLLVRGSTTQEERDRIVREGSYAGVIADTERELEQVKKGHAMAGVDAERAKLRKENIEKRATKANEKVNAAQERLISLNEQLGTELDQQKQEAGIKAQIKTAKESGRKTEGEAKILEEREKREKRINEIIGKESFTPGERSDLDRLMGEKAADEKRAAAAAAAAQPRPPYVSPGFQNVADQYGFFVNPVATALDNNKFVLQQLTTLIVAKLKEQGKVMEDGIRDVGGLKSREQYGPSDH